METRTRPPAWYLRAAYKAALNERWFADARGEPQRNNWHHEEWFRFAEQHDRLLVEAAREHSKTQVFAITQPLVEMAINPNVRILIISDVYPKAMERTKVLRQHLERNAELIADTGGSLRIASKKGDEEFTLRRPFYWLKEPTVRSTYAGGPISGGRYNIVIADDLVNYLANANTPGKRQQLARWWNDDVANSVAEGGRVWVIGTHQHPADLYEDLKRDPAYHVALYPAVDEEDTGYGHLGYATRNEGIEGGDANVLWPAAFSYAEHMAKKENPATYGSYLRQQQQLAVPETGLVYRKPLMDAAFERGKGVAYDEGAAQFIGLDPGYSKRAAMLCVQERSGDRIELWREHSFTQMLVEDVAGIVCDHARAFGLRALFYDAEDPSWGAKIMRERDAQGLKFDVVAVQFNKFKRRAVKTTRWLLESGAIAWGAPETITHMPGRTWVQDSLFRGEVSVLALDPNDEDMPLKSDDHGPDGWLAFASKWIKAWQKATNQKEA